MKTVRFVGAAVLLVAGMLLGLSSCANKGANGAIVATVNGSPIYASSLDMEMVRYEQLLLDEGDAEGAANPERMGRVRAAALEKLIDTELLYQEAVRAGHQASEQAVDEQLGGLIGQFESEERFEEALAELGIQREDLRRDLEHSLAIQGFVDNDIGPAVEVSVQDARAYYDSHPELFTEPERVRARHILLQVPSEGGEAAEQARRTLEELRGRVLAGEDFGALAEQYSQGPSAPAGGDLGYFGRGEMVEPFDRAVFALAVGELSGVVVTPFGYHLIQLVDRTEASLVEFERIAAQLVPYLEDQRIGDRLASLTRELRGKADISITGSAD